uniref:Uncharacterized protein n=1 Tax=Oryza brachyantha TaxID=4533 RepID=J3MRT7_ORYBR
MESCKPHVYNHQYVLLVLSTNELSKIAIRHNGPATAWPFVKTHTTRPFQHGLSLIQPRKDHFLSIAIRHNGPATAWPFVKTHMARRPWSRLTPTNTYTVAPPCHVTRANTTGAGCTYRDTVTGRSVEAEAARILNVRRESLSQSAPFMSSDVTCKALAVELQGPGRACVRRAEYAHTGHT